MTEDRTLPSGTPPSPDSGEPNPFSLPPPAAEVGPAPARREGRSLPLPSEATGTRPTSPRGDVPGAARGPFAPRRRVGWAYLLGCLLAAAMLVGFANPWSGTVALEWPWSLFARSGWTPPSAKVAFAILACLAPLVGLLLPASRGRGAVAALLSMLARVARAGETHPAPEGEVPGGL